MVEGPNLFSTPVILKLSPQVPPTVHVLGISPKIDKNSCPKYQPIDSDLKHPCKIKENLQAWPAGGTWGMGWEPLLYTSNKWVMRNGVRYHLFKIFWALFQCSTQEDALLLINIALCHCSPVKVSESSFSHLIILGDLIFLGNSKRSL